MHRKIDEAWLNPIEHNLQIMLLKTEPQVKHTCDTVRNTKDNLQQKQSRNPIRANLAKPCQAFAFWFWQFWFWSCRSLSKFFVQRLVQLWLWDTLRYSKSVRPQMTQSSDSHARSALGDSVSTEVSVFKRGAVSWANDSRKKKYGTGGMGSLRWAILNWYIDMGNYSSPSSGMSGFEVHDAPWYPHG